MLKSITITVPTKNGYADFSQNVIENQIFDLVYDFCDFLNRNNPDLFEGEIVSDYLYSDFIKSGKSIDEYLSSFKNTDFYWDEILRIKSYIRSCILSYLSKLQEIIIENKLDLNDIDEAIAEYLDAYEPEIKIVPESRFLSFSFCPKQKVEDEGVTLGVYLEDLKIKINERLGLDPINRHWFNVGEVKVPDCINDLFVSQGYKTEDLFDLSKVMSSKFLTSFQEELFSNYSNLSFLVFWLPSLDVGKLKNNSLTIMPSDRYNIGFVNLIHGQGSSLGIELEKPFTLNLNESIKIDENILWGHSLKSIYE